MDSKNPHAQSNSNMPSTSSRGPGPASKCPFDNLVVLNFKATASEYYYDHPHEVIQMAASVLYGPGPEWTVKPETDFSEIVRPTRHPKLTRFVKQLTGTSQEDVDKAEEFPKVFDKFEKWLETTGIAGSNFAVVTEASTNIWKIAQYQFILCNMPLPIYLKRFISIVEVFNGPTDRSAKEEVQGEEQAQALENPDVNNSALYNYNQDHCSEELSDECEPIPLDPNDYGGAVFDRGLADADRRDQERLAEADRRDQEALAEAVHQEQEGVYTPPETEQSAESDEFDRSAEELAFPNVMDPMEQPRARKRESDESIGSEEFAGSDNVPAKKIRIATKTYVEFLCNFYNIQRTEKPHSAADDASNLRDAIKKMLEAGGFVFYYNYMLVCFHKKRGTKQHFDLTTDWRLSYNAVRNVFEKVLPLFCRRIYFEEHVDYARCIACEKPLEVCGVDWVHRQFPSELFNPSNPSYVEIRFATEAGLDYDKSMQSASDDFEDDIDRNGEDSNDDEGHSDGGDKDL